MDTTDIAMLGSVAAAGPIAIMVRGTGAAIALGGLLIARLGALPENRTTNQTLESVS